MVNFRKQINSTRLAHLLTCTSYKVKEDCPIYLHVPIIKFRKISVHDLDFRFNMM